MVRLEQRFNQVGGKWGINYFGSTQSPRKEVIPPLIRSNFPAQLAFMVSRPEESSIILGGSDRDAVNLLGYGDAILRTPTGSDRIQTLLLEHDELTHIINQVVARWGGFHNEETSNSLDDNDLDLARKRLEFTVTLPFSVPTNPSVPTNSSVPSVPIEAEDSDWGIFLQIQQGRKGDLVDGRKIRKSKTQLCQEVFGIKGDGGNSMKRALEEYDRIRDKFVVPWIRELIQNRTPQWEIIEEIYSLSRLKQPKFKKSKPEEWLKISTLINAIASEMEYELDDIPTDFTEPSNNDLE
jgi:hypothetical protein